MRPVEADWYQQPGKKHYLRGYHYFETHFFDRITYLVIKDMLGLDFIFSCVELKVAITANGFPIGTLRTNSRLSYFHNQFVRQ